MTNSETFSGFQWLEKFLKFTLQKLACRRSYTLGVLILCIHLGSPAMLKAHQDYDGDGVPDLRDIDDDNDGILDKDEAYRCAGSLTNQGYLNYWFYNSVPSGNTLVNMPTSGSVGSGLASSIDLAGLINAHSPGDANTFSVLYTGYITIHTTETYTFYLNSDDGSRFSFNNSLLIDNDGLHSELELSASIALTPGVYPIRIEYFESSGDEILELSYSTPTIPKTLVPFSEVSATDFCDVDQDGISNNLDRDSDNDGIFDIIEAGGTDSNHDGIVDTFTDLDNDGLADIYDTSIGGTPLSIPDSDGDGYADYLDIDSDNDGIVDVTEAQPSTSTPVFPTETDTDSDGIDDAFESFTQPLTDTDSDGIPDYLDTDSDNDSIADSIEGWDTNDDGIPEHPYNETGDIDADGLLSMYDYVFIPGTGLNVTNNGKGSSFHPNYSTKYMTSERDWRESNDTDGDGVINRLDLDDDNDGIPDDEERVSIGFLNYEFYDGTPSGNSTSNIPTTGALSTGRVTSIDVSALQEAVDPGDPDSFSVRYTGYIHLGIEPGFEFFTTSDDGSTVFVDGLEVVANDGIHEAIEGTSIFEIPIPFAAGIYPITIEYFQSTGGKVLHLSYSGGSFAQTAIPFSILSTTEISDSDGDGIPNEFDLDSDNDGILDIVEAGGTDLDHDGIVDVFVDADGDGWADIYDNSVGGTPLSNPDQDGDGVLDFVDIDSDGDGITDIIEAQPSTGNPIIPSGTDADRDGIDDAFESTTLPMTDTDSDGTPDYLDTDSDNDGLADSIEGWDFNGDNVAETIASGTDSDDDGLDDAFDNVSTLGTPGNVYNNQNSTFFPNITSDYLSSEKDWRVNNDYDGDGIVNNIDPDDDNDGIPDNLEIQYFGQLNYEFYDSAPSGSSTLNIPTTGAVATGLVTNFDAAALQNAITPGDTQNYSIRYTGYINITQAGSYTFYLTSDDGSRILIDGSTVVGHDGIHGATERTGTISLSQGLHAFTVLYFQATGGRALTVSYSSSSITKTEIPFSVLQSTLHPDTDGDGIYNEFDLDSDNDGIFDIIEGGGVDVDDNGIADALTDTDSDGLVDAFDTDNGGTNLPVPDTDGDLLYDFLDIDSDGDGIADVIEGQPSSANPQLPSGNDSNGDGIDDNFQNNSLPLTDTDGDGIPDYLDTDSDNDTIPDQVEAWDLDGDNVADIVPLGFDSDLDGIDNAFDMVSTIGANNVSNNKSSNSYPNITTSEFGSERDWRSTNDQDGDGVINGVDLDSDNDGIPDALEKSCPAPVRYQGYLNYEFYDGVPSGNTVDNIPTSGALATGRHHNFDVAEIELNAGSGDPDTYAIRFTGYIELSATDTYSFYVTSDDGSKLYIDNILVVDNDGVHGPIEESGVIFLASGIHSFKVEYFEEFDGQELSISYSSSTITKTVIPRSVFTSTTSCDVDRDGLSNEYDLDSDNDGIMDIVEAGGIDADNNGLVDTFVDTDGDGYADLFDSDNGGTALLVPDTDSDGIRDFADMDSDGDGIVDILEAQLTIFSTPVRPVGTDSDADGIDNTFESTFLPIPDTDSDGIPDYKDTDSDGDGALDQVEGWDINGDFTADTTPSGTDIDGDGIDAAFDKVSTLNGTINIYNNQSFANFPDITTRHITSERDWRESNDPDNDGIFNYLDPDDDNDGILDVDEQNCMGLFKFQGWLNYEFYDIAEASINTVNAIPTTGALATGLASDFNVAYLQNLLTPADVNTYAIRYTGYFYVSALTTYVFYLKSDDGSRLSIDGTTVVNHDGTHSAAAEKTGAITLTEGVHSITILFFQNTGLHSLDISYSATGISKTALPFSLLSSSVYCDSDDDGVPNSLDLDSDNDGIYDIIEAGGVDVDGNGIADSTVDSDSDGLMDIFDSDTGGTPLASPDTDGDGIHNFLDIDSDGDGIVDIIEAQPSNPGPYLPLGVDANKNGIDDNFEANPLPVTDTDSDGVPDYIDTDSDNDTLTDAVEGWDTDGNRVANTVASGTDSDLDGLDNAFDLVSGTNPTTNVYNNQTSESFPDITSFYLTPEKDWRESNDYDGDGIVEDLDQDDDNDGIPDSIEASCENKLNYAFYDEAPGGFTLDNLPTSGVANGIATSFDVSAIQTTHSIDASTFTIIFTGYIRISTTNSYTFYTNSNDGSRLYIDDVLIVDNDGLHAAQERSGTVSLNMGYHVLRVEYFQGNDSKSLSVSYASSSISKTTIPFSILSISMGCDFDGDGIVNSRDLDSDGDGIPDLVEAGGSDTDHNGLVDNLTDTDGDGLVDLYDSDDGGNPLTAIDTDGDGKANFQDIDADGDGIVDIIEAQPSTGSPIVPLGTDTNENGIDDVFEATPLALTDTDGDATPDYLDLDSDNDGYPDSVEGWDTDGDLIANLFPSLVDTDGDGLDNSFDLVVGPNSTTNIYNSQTSDDFPDITTAGRGPERDWRESNDHDGDGVLDTNDLDDDNDGIPDVAERDCYGFLNYEFYDSAPSGNTVSNIPSSGALATGVVGSFNATYLQVLHTPSDADTYSIRYTGYIHIDVEDTYTFYLSSDDGSRLLIDGNQIINHDGLHGTGTTVPGSVFLTTGTHSFTLLYFENTFSSGLTVSYSSSTISTTPVPFSILSPTEFCDSDLDGIPNEFDLDSDNDGIPDIIEAGGTDANGDGRVDSFTDTDGDGLANTFDSDNGGTPLAVGDSDADGFKDAYDTDSDNDGIPDLLEAGGIDTNQDGRVDTTTDSDGDGWADVFDSDHGGTPLSIPDLDGDGKPNYKDIDADGDGIVDIIEAQSSTSSPAVPTGVDTDRDGIDDAFENNPLIIIDTDSDGTPDYLDTNSDNDALPDLIEGWDTDGDYTANTTPSGSDTDGDGLDDAFDLITGPNSTINVYNNQSSSSFPDITTASLTTERDWREVIIIDCKPGDVGTNLLFWLMAQPGTNWSDLSGNFYAVNETGSTTATLLNYNPAFTFDGADLFNTNLNINAGTRPDLAVIAVYKPSIDFAGSVWGEENGGNDRFIQDSSSPAGFEESVGKGEGALSPVNGLFAPGVTSISTVIYNDGISGGSRVLINGGQSATFTANQAAGSSNNLQVGALGNSTARFSGVIAEMIVYDQLLSSETDMKQIQSYLALKYGVTMSSDTDGDGSTFEAGEGDYIASDGTTVYWDASVNTAYHHGIAGIVRDDGYCLSQLQSVSDQADAIVSIGLDDSVNGLETSNALNESSFSSNFTALMWGHDGEALYDRDENIDFDPLQVKSRLNREWKVQKTGSVGNVTMRFNVGILEGPTGTGTNDESKIVLLIDADGDFSRDAQVVMQSLVIADDGFVNFNLDLPDGAFFTLASTEDVALDIHLLSFSAKPSKDHIMLEWATLSESNNSFFRLERSADGENFSPIGYKEGAGESSEVIYYSFKDMNPVQGINYYRLVDVDNVGNENYSEVVRASFYHDKMVFLPRPNPVASGASIFVDIPENQSVDDIRLVQLNGVEVFIEMLRTRDHLEIVPHNAPQGIYLLTMLVNGEHVRFKIIVSN